MAGKGDQQKSSETATGGAAGKGGGGAALLVADDGDGEEEYGSVARLDADEGSSSGSASDGDDISSSSAAVAVLSDDVETKGSRCNIGIIKILEAHESNLGNFCLNDDNRPGQYNAMKQLYFDLLYAPNCSYKSYINEQGNTNKTIIQLLFRGLFRLLGGKKVTFQKKFVHIYRILNILVLDQEAE